MTGNSPDLPPRILIIAGSDSGGGAGIQADVRTVAAWGGFPTTAITSLTAQNTQGVQGILPIPAAFVEAQIRAVLTDIGADCIKIGVLPNASVIKAVSKTLRELALDIPILLDPVMVASSGDCLMAEAEIAVLVESLFPLACLCTPNMPEAALITGQPVGNIDEMRSAAQKMIAMGVSWVLVKGGHGQGQVIHDLLMSKQGETLFEDTRLDSRNTHGTGCSLASAIAVGLARGQGTDGAVEEARQWVRAAIDQGPSIGHGDHRPLGFPNRPL